MAKRRELQNDERQRIVEADRLLAAATNSGNYDAKANLQLQTQAPVSMTDCSFTLDDLAAERAKGRRGKTLVIIHSPNVYDVSTFRHPGGRQVLRAAAAQGVDVGDEFENWHSDHARMLMRKYYVGRIVGPDSTT